MWIINVPAYEVEQGRHPDPGPNSVLIQISDPGGFVPEPKFRFLEIHKFEFMDLSEFDLRLRPSLEETEITEKQAQEIVNILLSAFERKMNVVVHCMMGICRSGAVVNIGRDIGFEDKGRFRAPNLRVERKLSHALVDTWDEKEHNENQL